MARLNFELFKWDDSPGLKHHCGVCKMPLANPNAMQTCIGEHVEPCERFHQQLHFIRKSHDCTSCHITVEMHRKRHREILVTLNHMKEENSKKYLNAAITARKEGKKLKKSLIKSTRVCASDIFTATSYAFVSEAIYGTTMWGKGAGAKCQISAGQDSMLDNKGLSSSSAAIQTKQKVETSKSLWSHEKSFRRTSSSPHTSSLDPLLAIDQTIFERLGLDLTGMQSWSKKRKNLLKKLAAIISEDIKITEKEDQETKIRKDAFLRYVTRRAVNNLNELHEQFSWSTGEIVKQPRS